MIFSHDINSIHVQYLLVVLVFSLFVFIPIGICKDEILSNIYIIWILNSFGGFFYSVRLDISFVPGINWVSHLICACMLIGSYFYKNLNPAPTRHFLCLITSDLKFSNICNQTQPIVKWHRKVSLKNSKP